MPQLSKLIRRHHSANPLVPLALTGAGDATGSGMSVLVPRPGVFRFTRPSAKAVLVELACPATTTIGVTRARAVCVLAHSPSVFDLRRAQANVVFALAAIPTTRDLRRVTARAVFALDARPTVFDFRLPIDSAVCAELARPATTLCPSLASATAGSRSLTSNGFVSPG